MIAPTTNIFIVGLFSVLCFAAGAQAQQPTDAQRNAVRSACRSDFIAQCSGVTPGGMEALSCLQQHNASLSKPCREAISNLDGPKKSSNESPPQSDVTPPTTTAAAAPKQPTSAQRDAVKSSCRSDFMTQCSGVTPGGVQALACLQQHSATLSPSCQAAVGAIGGGGPTQATNPAKPPAGGAAAVATPTASFTPREELVVVRRTCGPDFRALCHSVPLGGGRGINCLRDNFARLSPACQRVLSNGL
ncbi:MULTISPECIES: hypothetical protein [unclassified Rhizobium]|uniref:hypothetical protein n=1 Tax=unclassified Rhizobium TaxID=2613769 RepID=UPI001ADD4F19|nr:MULTISPECIES: hypothetical protein [unclassified Rhizobium]MBO9127414.1 hypothetical protein [Rhizobium sp. 16-488-2b]MBO9177857.1 hypothetical protein [Rhizobium sp. 16-488-2a]